MEIDITLLNAARTMDEAALIQIFDLYSSQLYRFALHLCGDPVVADHIVGDVFARFLEQLSLGKGPTSNLKAYLFQTAYHLVVDDARRSERRAPLETALSMRDEAKSVDGEDRALIEALLQIIQRDLSDDQRHVIILRFWEELSLADTAAILGKRVDHVKVIQARALVKLRKALRHEETTISSRNRDSTPLLAPRRSPA